MSPVSRDADQASPPGASSLGLWLDRAIDRGADAGSEPNGALGDLRELKARLVAQRLQLAVLGQFKRGKSTLLNALLGADILPMGVLPVTAISTFLEAAPEPRLQVIHEDGRAEPVAGLASAEAMRARLLDLVAEAANPRNEKGLAQVIVGMPAPFLEEGVTLIDTPGVGSTLPHNTLAAEATLSACDAALFVVSPDPPITETEVGYLARIQPLVGRIIMVLNKIDLVGGAEADQTEEFLRRALIERLGLSEPLIFRVSARAALEGRLSHDASLVAKSGVPGLEAYLAQFVAEEKAWVLASAIARKARVCVGELRFHSALRLQSLRLPLADLERRRHGFEEAVGGFESERQVVGDLLAADRKRALVALDQEASDLRSALAAKLKADFDRRIAAGENAREAWAQVSGDVPSLFESEMKAAIEVARTRLDGLLAAHQVRADDLVDKVRRAAAELFEVPFQTPSSPPRFEVRFLPYWTVNRPDALNPLAPGAFDALLPRGFRVRHARRRTHDALSDIALRNVESLRWAMRRNIEDALRRFASEIDGRFSASLAATRDVLSEAVTRRTQYASDTGVEMDRLHGLVAEFEEIEKALAGLAGATPGVDRGGASEPSRNRA